MPGRQGFQFKQFFVAHAGSAMKVGTDSIMLGSWSQPENAKLILDIGTGSGLLALMMAQKSQPATRIVGIDVDPKAIEQARENGLSCPWAEKLQFEHTKVQDFAPDRQFDFIISNPPYFVPKAGRLENKDPQFIKEQRRLARHTLELTFSELLAAVEKLLAKTGVFTCVLPVQEGQQLVELAKTFGLYCVQKLLVATAPDKNASRVLLKFTFEAESTVTGNILVRDLNLGYTKDYKKLCKDFYLNF